MAVGHTAGTACFVERLHAATPPDWPPRGLSNGRAMLAVGSWWWAWSHCDLRALSTSVLTQPPHANVRMVHHTLPVWSSGARRHLVCVLRGRSSRDAHSLPLMEHPTRASVCRGGADATTKTQTPRAHLSRSHFFSLLLRARPRRSVGDSLPDDVRLGWRM